MTTGTTKAQTDDQTRVLELADEHPDATPKEIAEMTDDGAIQAPYVREITNSYHLPESDGGDAIVLSSPDEINVDHYECTICGKESDDPASLTKHVGISKSGGHEGVSATDDSGTIEAVGENTEALERLAALDRTSGTITPGHVEVLHGIDQYPKSSYDGLAEFGDTTKGTIGRRITALGIPRPPGAHAVEARVEGAREVLDEAGIRFDLDADTSSDGDAKPDVLSLQPGDGREHTVVGGWYEAAINNVVGYGLFCTLAQNPNGDRRGDLRGLATSGDLPNGYVPGDYDNGDDVVVERLHDDAEGGEKLSLRVVTDPDGEIVADRPRVPPAAADSDDEADDSDETLAGMDATDEPSEASDVPSADEVDAPDTDGDGFYSDRVQAYEDYWLWVDKVRWLGHHLGRSQATKFNSEESPLARAYNEAMGAKHDFQDDCRDLAGNLPTYRDQFDEPAWDHRVEDDPKGGDDDPVHLPADFELPDVWDADTFEAIGGDPAVEMIEEIEGRIRMLEAGISETASLVEEISDADLDAEIDREHPASQDLHARHDVLQEAIGCANGGPDETKLETLMAQINSLEKAITHRDEREPDEKFTLHLTGEQMKKLVRDAPDDVADLALDALADAH